MNIECIQYISGHCDFSNSKINIKNVMLMELVHLQQYISNFMANSELIIIITFILDSTKEQNHPGRTKGLKSMAPKGNVG